MNRGYCKECKKMVLLAEKGTTNHALHLVLTLLTGGFWLLIWALCILFNDKEYRCPVCGTSDIIKGDLDRETIKKLEKGEINKKEIEKKQNDELLKWFLVIIVGFPFIMALVVFLDTYFNLGGN